MRHIPNLTIAILSFKRPEYLSHLLKVLRNQHCTAPIVIVDADSQHGSKNLTHNWEKKLNIRYLASPSSNRAVCRNLALHSAATRFLAFLDDDCIPKSDWFQIATNLVSQWKNPNTAFIFGATSSFHPNHPLVHVRTLKYQSWVKSHLKNASRLDILDTKNCILDLDYLKKYNLKFDQCLHRSQDRDLALQCYAKGATGKFVPSLKVKHREIQSILPFLTRAFEQGRFKLKVEHKWRHILPQTHLQLDLAPLNQLELFYFFLHSLAARAGYHWEALLTINRSSK